MGASPIFRSTATHLQTAARHGHHGRFVPQRPLSLARLSWALPLALSSLTPLLCMRPGAGASSATLTILQLRDGSPLSQANIWSNDFYINRPIVRLCETVTHAARKDNDILSEPQSGMRACHTFWKLLAMQWFPIWSTLAVLKPVVVPGVRLPILRGYRAVSLGALNSLSRLWGVGEIDASMKSIRLVIWSDNLIICSCILDIAELRSSAGGSTATPLPLFTSFSKHTTTSALTERLFALASSPI